MKARNRLHPKAVNRVTGKGNSEPTSGVAAVQALLPGRRAVRLLEGGAVVVVRGVLMGMVRLCRRVPMLRLPTSPCPPPPCTLPAAAPHIPADQHNALRLRIGEIKRVSAQLLMQRNAAVSALHVARSSKGPSILVGSVGCSA